MTFSKFGITYERLNEDNYAITRTWRNSDFVRQQMTYTEFISKEEHEKWFESINNDTNYYFIAKNNDVPIAVVNLKNVTHESAEAGIFLISPDNKKRLIVARIVMGLGDFGFIDLGLLTMYSTVIQSNTSAVSLNTKFGALLIPEKSTEHILYYIFDNARYFEHTESMRNYFSKSFIDSI